MASASLFLGLFFAFYVGNGTLFRPRSPAVARPIDTTLTSARRSPPSRWRVDCSGSSTSTSPSPAP